MQRKCNLSFDIKLSINAEDLSIPDDLNINDKEEVGKWIASNFLIDTLLDFDYMQVSDVNVPWHCIVEA